MCVAIAQPAGSRTLTEDELLNGWIGNPDGGGFAFINEAGVIEDHHFMEFDEFALNYLAAHQTNGATSAFLVHMRIATTGSVCLRNTHPFKVCDDTFMIHNGMISGYKQNSKDRASCFCF